MDVSMKMLKAVIITLLIISAAVLAINAPDEELRSEVKTIIDNADSLPPEGGADTNNAYFAVLGFESSEGKDIAAEGKRIHAQYYQSLKEDSLQKVNISGAGEPLKFARPSAIAQCSYDTILPVRSGCLTFYAQNNSNHAQLYQDNNLLLGRYSQLRSYAEYRDLMVPAPWSSPADLSSAIYSAHLLYAAEAANLFNQGQQQQAIKMLIGDIGIWRKFLAGTANTAGKICAQQALMRNYTLLKEMSGSYTGDTRSYEMKAALAPLTQEEKSFDLVVDGYIQHLWRSLSRKRWPFTQKKMSLVQRFFCRENATLNLAYEICDSLKRTANVAPEQLKTERTILAEKIQNAGKVRIDMLYNPVGKLIVAEAFSSGVSSLNTRIQLVTDKISALGKSTL